jgi:Ca2+/Na+ antiporter
MYLSINPSINPFIYPFIYPSIYPSVDHPISLHEILIMFYILCMSVYVRRSFRSMHHSCPKKKN